MTIEFYCEKCYQRVETPDQTAGKKGRCPYCEALIDIPTESQPELPSEQNARQIGLQDLVDESPNTRSGGHQHVKIGTVSGPGGQWRETDNLVRWGTDQKGALLRQKQQAREFAQRELAAPAIGLIIAASFGLVITAFFTFYVAIQASIFMADGELNMAVFAMWLSLIVISVLAETLIIVGANHMRSTRSYSMSIASVVIACLPAQPICILSAPLALWSVFLLLRPEIRDSFRKF